jgi:hypothetical protein
LEAKADRRPGATQAGTGANARPVPSSFAAPLPAPVKRQGRGMNRRLAFNCVVGVGEANCPPDTRILDILGERNRFGKIMRAPTLARHS